MGGKTQFVKELPAQKTVAQVGVTAKTTKTRGLCHENSDVVEHCGLFEEHGIQVRMGSKGCDLNALLGHLLAVS
jgi:hypothetical protein